jgi:anaerobic selenocysteine-containing dehydrogenase
LSDQKSRLSRRDFLKMSGTVMAGAALAACAAPAAPVAAPQAAEQAAAPAVNTGAKQTVRYLSWWFEEGQRGATWNLYRRICSDQDEGEIKKTAICARFQRRQSEKEVYCVSTSS